MIFGRKKKYALLIKQKYFRDYKYVIKSVIARERLLYVEYDAYVKLN